MKTLKFKYCVIKDNEIYCSNTEIFSNFKYGICLEEVNISILKSHIKVLGNITHELYNYDFVSLKKVDEFINPNYKMVDPSLFGFGKKLPYLKGAYKLKKSSKYKTLIQNYIIKIYE